MLRFRILGPVEVFDGERRLAVGGPRPLALLASLLVHANHAVSADVLVEAVWGETGSAGAVKRLQMAIARLRTALQPLAGGGDSVLRTVSGGYLLTVGPGELDADVFQARLEEGRSALEGGDPLRGAEVLRSALALWRGPAFAELAYEAFTQGEIRRLEELRIMALEARIDADLRLRRHAELIGELEALTAAHPTREGLAGQLMVALYRCGRQAEALEAFQRIRAHLAGELGLEPGPALKALQADILDQAPSSTLATDEPASVQPVKPAVDRQGGDETSQETRRPAGEPARVPSIPTATVGREDDLARLRVLLTDPATRLATVVGTAGVGKTRVALEIGRMLADTRADGAAFVSLASVAESEHVALAIAQAVDVLAAPDVPIDDMLVRYFAHRDMLLIVDNYEHVLDAAPLIADLLAAAPRLIVLVTSREPLRLRAEHIFELAPLALPAADLEHPRPQQSPAVALFVQLARAHDPVFAPTLEEMRDIALLCRRLDGLPLAIELAAGRVGLLSARELTRRLNEGTDVLGPGPRDAPQRQQTLHSTLNWSYELLEADEQAAFAHLGVFAGGADVATAQKVTGAPLEVLEALVAKQLILRTRSGDGEWRLGMLEIIREFARARLVAGPDAELVAFRHAQHFLELSETVAVGLRRSGSEECAAQLDAEIDNVRAALAWALQRPAPELALRLAVAFDEYLEVRHPAEGEQLIETALALADARVPARVRAEALHRRAIHLVSRSSYASAEATARENFALCKELGDARGRSLSLVDLAYARLGMQQRREAGDTACEAVEWARRAADDVALATALAVQVLAAETLERSLESAEEAATLYARVGNVWLLSSLWVNLAYRALDTGDASVAERSLRLAREAAQQAGQAGDLRLPLIDGNQGLLELFRGDYARAAAAFCDELKRARQYGFERNLYEGLGGMAAVLAASDGDPTTAARLCGAADARTAERHSPVLLDRLDTIFEGARERLGDDTWAGAYAAGSELDGGDAVDLALAAARTVHSPGTVSSAGS